MSDTGEELVKYSMQSRPAVTPFSFTASDGTTRTVWINVLRAVRLRNGVEIVER